MVALASGLVIYIVFFVFNAGQNIAALFVVLVGAASFILNSKLARQSIAVHRRFGYRGSVNEARIIWALGGLAVVLIGTFWLIL